MATRFDFEREFTHPESGLRPSERHVLHVLCMRIDRDAFRIRSEFQPSLTDLSRDMGCDRRTVMRRLARVEAKGWITRDKPTVHDARTKHARTHYTLRLPPGYTPKARGSSIWQLGAESPAAEGSTPPELGAEGHEARGRTPRRSSESSGSSASEIDVIIDKIRERTSTTIGRAQAALIRTELLERARGTISDPKAWLSAAISRETDVSRWLPTPSPPRYSDLQRDGTYKK